MSAVIPDWEAGKENTAPLRKGRRVTRLAESLTEAYDEDRRIRNELHIHEFERLVSRTEVDGFDIPDGIVDDDDPLKHWVRYIQFHQENYPSDTANQFKLVERCFRAMSKMSKYTNDERFVKICCVFADKSKRPHDVFKYCHEQKIGVELAIFWIAWAFVAEKEENFQFAEKIFEKGIRKNAKPIKILQERLKQFQRRMSRYWLNSTQNDDLDYEENAEDSRRARGVLGYLDKDAVARNDRSRSVISQPRGRQVRPRSPGNIQKTAPFPIFVDENTEPSDPNLDNSFSVHNRTYPRQDELLKENTLIPARWSQNGALSSTAVYSHRQPVPTRQDHTLDFNIFVEYSADQIENEEDDRRRTHHRQNRDERTFRERHDGTVAEKLSHDPLRYVKNPAKLGKDCPTYQNGQQETRSFPKSGSLQDEQSFEEARLKAKYYKIASADLNINYLKIEQSIEEVSMESSVHEVASFFVKLDVDYESFHKGSLEFGMKESININNMGNDNVYLHDRETPRNASIASSNIDEAAAAGLEGPKEEQTINTAWAQKEISMMFFCSPTKAIDNSFQDMNRLSEERITTVETILDVEGLNGLDSSFQADSSNHPMPLADVRWKDPFKRGKREHASMFQIYEDKLENNNNDGALSFQIYSD